MNKQATWLQRAKNVLETPKFWWFILLLLIVQAAWIALSGKYPMAFDEDFHLGIIRLYAHHINPFWSHQPEAADPFGAVARDPSYLYQYLMSFPYKLIKLFTSDQTVTVIWLRFINIGLFAAGLALYRRLLMTMRASRTLVHLSLLLFVLLPIVPFLAAQINYDNLLMPMVALTLILTVRFERSLSQKKLDIRDLFLLLTACLLTSLVKYAFLPIFIAIVAFLLVRLWHIEHTRDDFWRAAGFSWRSLSWSWQAGLIAALIVAGGLFTQRIGYNIVRYHEPAPDCNKVLTIEQCREYGPWIRDYNFKLNRVATPKNPLVYSGDWLYGMWLRTFFALGGPETTYETRGPLLLPGIGAIVLGSLGLLALALKAKIIFRLYNAPVVWLFLTVALSYIAFLWLDEFQAYLHTGQPVAINGRYLLPVLPPFILLMTVAVARLTQAYRGLQLGLAMLAVLCLAWGGGTLTFILRSNPTWYWNNAAVRSANNAVHNVAGPFVPGYHNPIQFLR